ncbi:MAG: hypothetical protein AABY09_03530, partial [Nanoarchaeota archaeon]
QVFRYSFDVPIVKRDDGTYGSTGKVYVNAKGSTYVDLQHSSWWNLSCGYRTSVHVMPKVTDTNMQIPISILTNGTNWNDKIYIIDNRTNAELAWVNFSDFKTNNPTQIWTNASVTANSGFGIDIYYNCSSNTPTYNLEDVFLLARGYNSQANVDNYDTGYGPGVADTTYRLELNASMKMSGDQSQRDYNLTAKNAGSNITIIAYNYLSTTSLPDARTKTVYVSSGSALLGNTAYDEDTADGCQTTLDKWCIGVNASYVLDYLPLTTTWNRHKITINATGTSLWNNETFRYHSGKVAWNKFTIYNGGHAGGTDMWADLFYIYRDYGVDNPTCTPLNEESPYMPTNPDPTLSPTTAYTNTNLNCSVGTYINDANGDSMSVLFNLTVNGVQAAEYVLGNQANGTKPTWIIASGNYTMGDSVKCNITLFDGAFYSATNSSNTVTILNSLPDIVGYNSSSLNRTDFEMVQNVTYQENETVRFAVNVSDADASEGNDTLWNSWFVDNVFSSLTQSSWFNAAWNLFSAGLHTVRVDVNDSSNATDSFTWNVLIANVVNKVWSVDYVSPTPSNGVALSG